MIAQYTDMDDTVFKNGKMYFLNVQYDEKKLDHLSIMRYSSYSFKNPKTPPYDALEVPLSVWKDHDKAVQHSNPPKHEEVKLIEFNLEVSSGDYEATSELYPWKG
jgi:hypothetical protein